MPVSARFHALRDKVLATTDRAFAELVRLAPMKDGRVDPARPSIEIEGILRTAGQVSMNMDGGSGGSLQVRIAAGKAELAYDPVRYPGISHLAKDKVRAIARTGEFWFEVASVNNRSHTRVVLELNVA